MRSLPVILLLVVAALCATVLAANPYDTITQPFAIAGDFKRLEKKSPSPFACYNSTLGGWSELNWGEVYPVGSAANKVQLKSGEVIYLDVDGAGNTILVFWSQSLANTFVLSTKNSILVISSLTTMFLSNDEKKLFLVGSISKIGNNVITSTPNVKVVMFDLSTLSLTAPAALPVPTEITSTYTDTTNTIDLCQKWLPLSNGVVCPMGLRPNGGTPQYGFMQYDNSGAWKFWTAPSINPTSTGLVEYQVSKDGNLYLKVYDTTSRQTSFMKYNMGSDFNTVKQLNAPNASFGVGPNYVAMWTVSNDNIYYALSVGSNIYDTDVQNIQVLNIATTAVTPLGLSTVRLVSGSSVNTALTRANADNSSIVQSMSNMYYDYNIKKLVLQMTTDNVLQVFGSRDTWSTDLQVGYRFQTLGNLLVWDETLNKYSVPYGGGYASGTLLTSSATSGLTCIHSGNTVSVVYYRTWAPNFGVYDPTSDKFVADSKVSGLLDISAPYTGVSSASTIKAIENSDGNGVVYLAGFFRSIEGKTYNSIVQRNKDGSLTALDGGVLSKALNYDSFDNAVPGTIIKLVRSNDNKYLFVYGSFDRVGTAKIVANGVAVWNIQTKAWMKLQSLWGSNSISDIDYDGTYLYVTGSISTAGKYVVNNIARYEMSSGTWQPMNQGIDGSGKLFVYNGRVIVYGPATGSLVRFPGSFAVWDNNLWREISMDSVTQPNCQTKNYCTNSVSGYVSIYRGQMYLISPGTSQVLIPADNSLSSFKTFINAAAPGRGLFNYPKSNTLAIATLGTTQFYEFNYNLMNQQQTTTRDASVLADGAIQAISAANKSLISIALMIVAVVVALLF